MYSQRSMFQSTMCDQQTLGSFRLIACDLFIGIFKATINRLLSGLRKRAKKKSIFDKLLSPFDHIMQLK